MSGQSTKLFKIENHHLKGRQLVATRRIRAGELIIDEPALVSCPGFARGNSYENTPVVNVGNENAPLGEFLQEDASVCLVCYANLQASMCVRCPSCNLVLCSDHCQTHVQHSQNECLVFPQISHVWGRGSSRSKKSLYNLVSVIRGLFYKFRNATNWAQISNLESKSEALEKIGAFVDLEDVFSSLSWQMFAFELDSGPEIDKQAKLDKHADIAEAAKHCLGVMRINAFSDFSESYSREGLFFLSSFMSHSCVVNTDRQIGSGTEGLRMLVRASVDIDKDQPITTTYLSLLYNTEERQRIMMSSWLFVCSCERCQDPDECQVYSGKTYFNTENSTKPSLDSASHLKAISVARPASFRQIEKVEQWLDSFDNCTWVHPNHSVFSHIKLFLCQCYGRQTGGLKQLTVQQLKRKVRYCWELGRIFEKVSPGVQMLTGILLLCPI